MKFDVQQSQSAVRSEMTALIISVPELGRTFELDLNYSAVLEYSRLPALRALDLLVFGAVVYAIDKIASRKDATDRWTRTLEVTLPVADLTGWEEAKPHFERSISFLTGDVWRFTFVQAEHGFARHRRNRRRILERFTNSPVVSLLSGGLDSFIAAINLLHDNKRGKILFVSHYDGHVAGPASDQKRLRRVLENHFPSRIQHLQMRTGVKETDESVSANDGKMEFETSFRSRSLIFLTLAMYAAAKAGAGTPVHIPENGPIALNLPLNPSRRGSCSTRTVHPFFLQTLQNGVDALGIDHKISNPYEFDTKGEMVRDCKRADILTQAASLSNSCAKAGRKMHWKKRTAKACGTCVPCIFRRASMHLVGADDEQYGNDVFAANPATIPDFHALLGLVSSHPTEKDIARMLFANGSLPLQDLDRYSSTVHRMLAEVRKWIKDNTAKAPAAGIKARTQ
ncbi:MAG TPA: Qat anti-phage system QueC-like protein QatC [Prosthecobacter sp.]